MTLGPTRLKHDPDFQWETGCNVADEELVVGTYDHGALRARILAGALATGAAATTAAVLIGDGVPSVARAAGWTFAAAWKPVIGATAGAAILAGAYWLGVQSRPATADEGGIRTPAPIVAPAIFDTEPDAGAVPVRREEVVVLPTASLRTGTPDAPPSVTAIDPDADRVDSTVSRQPPPPPGSPPPSVMREQNYVMELASEALKDGYPVRAEQLYERYRAEWPHGPSVLEATYGLLEARFARGDAAGAERLAKKMQDDPMFSEKREEILRFRAESLVQLDRCGEALLLAEELSARSAAPVRRACRHREGD